MASVVPAVAPVRPRVFDRNFGGTRLLEELVEEYFDEHGAGILWVAGTAGAGKSIALSHLAARFGEKRDFQFLDDVEIDDLDSIKKLQTAEHLVVAGSRDVPRSEAQFLLQPWSSDELVEYLLKAHHNQCLRIMQILGTTPRKLWLPEIARIVVDQLALDASLEAPQDAIKNFLLGELEHESDLDAVRQLCLAYLQGGGEALLYLSGPSIQNLSEKVRRLVRHDFVQVPLAAEQVIHNLENSRSVNVLLEGRFPLAVIQTIARSLVPNSRSLSRLNTIFNTARRTKSHSMVASILFAYDEKWRPKVNRSIPFEFRHAYFARADWANIDLRGAVLTNTDFRKAKLTGGVLDNAIMIEGNFDQANLASASMNEAVAIKASFSGTNFHEAKLYNANLTDANLTSAALHKATLRRIKLSGADLSSAVFLGADLSGACLIGAQLNETILHECNLRRVDARFVDFRTAQLDRVQAEKADFRGANLEDVHWEGVNLKRALLHGAYLSGSKLPAVNFRDANLSNTCLGEIEWEHADLRNANLSSATFHMGSSRSGLVDSPYASEGTRTGFYTEELEELYFKSPEQVRKANLRGADLRGANIQNVDFYLVDLRDALLDRHQRRHAANSGAILSE